MTEWQKVRLGDIIDLQRGYDLTNSERESGTVPVIGSAGINGYHSKYRAGGPGVTIGRSGASFGNATYSKEDYWPHNTTLFVTSFKNNNPYWVFLTLKSIDFSSFNSGSAQPSLNRNYLYNIPINAPPRSTQDRIASVLSAYDDLIENNTRRIGVLEEMARVLYREWLVHFRLPKVQGELGSGSGPSRALPLTPFYSGEIPAGWETKSVKDIANVVYGFPFASKQFNTHSEGDPVVRIRDIPNGFSLTSTTEAADSKYHIRNGHILAGMDGDFHLCIWSGGHALQNQRVARFESKGEIGNFHLFLLLEGPIRDLNKTIVGTTVAHLGDAHIKLIKILWPPADVRELAREHLEPLSEQIISLKCRNRALRAARDLLLPKLLSGELSVDRIPDPAAVAP